MKGHRNRGGRTPLVVCTVTFAIVAVGVLLSACGGSDSPQDVPVTITVAGPNAVSQWNEIASNTVNIPGTATGTPEEQRPNASADLATVHVAIYDAVMAIVGTHRPYAVIAPSAAADASQEAAIGTAAYRVLLGLFPSRTAQYQTAYDDFMAGIADGPAKTKGTAIGAETAAGILALRANDGRSVVLAPYVPGTGPGQFRGVNPVNRNGPYIKPFALASNAQFRAPPPPALDSAVYAADFNETRTLGSATSAIRTADQSELALFGTSTPPLYWQANMRTFATTGGSLAEHARLMAMVWVAQNDAGNACFDSKYFYERWRPLSAITLADTDGNDATTADPAWLPSMPTPNHPEYPAAHSCISGAMAEILRPTTARRTSRSTSSAPDPRPGSRVTTPRCRRCCRKSRSRASPAACTFGLRPSRARRSAARSRSGSSRTASRPAEGRRYSTATTIIWTRSTPS